jgi:hypothetical protein
MSAVRMISSRNAQPKDEQGQRQECPEIKRRRLAVLSLSQYLAQRQKFRENL